MNDGHQKMHRGLAPACFMWTPILPESESATYTEVVAEEKSRDQTPIKGGVPSGVSGADKTARRT